MRTFPPAPSPEPIAVAEALLAWVALHGVRNLVFWNVDARIKLLITRFAAPTLRLIDVSPGHYAFEELDAALPWAAAFDVERRDYYARLDALVLKYRADGVPPARHVCVIPNGVATPTAPCFLVSGRIAPSKRLECIIDAFRLVRERHADAELHVIGSAEPRDAAYAKSLLHGATGMPVVFRGASSDLAFLAEPFTAAVVLGTHQGSPNAVLEAMSAGIPVIANASGGTGEIVRDGETGYLLAENCQADELALAMNLAIDEPLMNCQMGSGARAFVARHHGTGAMVRAYLALFDPDGVRSEVAPGTVHTSRPTPA